MVRRSSFVSQTIIGLTQGKCILVYQSTRYTILYGNLVYLSHG